MRFLEHSAICDVICNKNPAQTKFTSPGPRSGRKISFRFRDRIWLQVFFDTGITRSHMGIPKATTVVHQNIWKPSQKVESCLVFLWHKRCIRLYLLLYHLCNDSCCLIPNLDIYSVIWGIMGLFRSLWLLILEGNAVSFASSPKYHWWST